MLRHQILLIYRNFKRFKSTFLINLIGLSTGMACAMLIFLWVNDELKVDKFHEKDAQLYQVMTNYQYTESTNTNLETDGILAEALAEEMPEVAYATVATPVYWFEKFTLSLKGNNIKAVGRYAGKDFFHVFSYGLMEGDLDQVLADKYSIVISKELAMNLFRTTENVVGKTIEFQHEKLFQVSGVFAGTPENSTDQFDFVVPFSNFQEMHPRFAEWDQRGPSTYLILNEDTDPVQFNNKINRFYQKKTRETNITLFVSQYSDNYLYGNYENGVQAGGRVGYVKLFSIIAIFILFIACINFMNLSTAKASVRIKEIGIKKAMGSSRKNLIFQYMGESIFMAFMSFLIALLLVWLFLPLFNEITAKHIAPSLNFPIGLSFLGITLFTGLFAGSYPALYLSGFRPVVVLKGKLNTSVGELMARKSLVVFQFALSIILIIAVLVVYKQVDFVQSENIGYDKENVVCFDIEGKVAENPRTFIQEVKAIPGIVNASSANSRLTGSYGATSGLEWEGKNPEDIISFEMVQVNYDLIETLGIEMVAGRSFSRNYSSDISKLIFNESAIQAMGLQDPVGKTIKFWRNDVEILGVAKDFHIESFHEKVKPLILRLLPEQTDYIMAKFEAGKERETLDKLQEFYSTYNPGFVLDYRFLDQNYQALYEAEKRVADLSKYFAGLAILISCLGLFGLAAFTSESRKKEIGIRKVLGASVAGVVALLTHDFIRLILLSIAIALPIAWWASTQWLAGFAYKTRLDWGIFIGSGLLVIVIALFTVSTQALRAATINPVDSLRSE